MATQVVDDKAAQLTASRIVSAAAAPAALAPAAPALAPAPPVAAPAGAPAQLTGWGRCPVTWGYETGSEDLDAATEGAVLSRGLGRSYGDASLPAPGARRVASTRRGDRLLAFDPATGLVRAEAGLTLRELNRLFLPRGWSVPVSPGTQLVTLGGMVAADVHGKNHHRAGTFGEHVGGLRVKVADGRVIGCSDMVASDLFEATLGGMGLTGHVLEVAFRMERIPSPWIWAETERAGDLDALLDRLGEASRTWPFTAAWADLLARGPKMGRGVVFKGRWAEPGEAPAAPPPPRREVRVPFQPPNWALSRPTVKAFNALTYWKHRHAVRRGVEHPQAFFYPLDAVGDWNLLYGRRGFTQYQCVLPDPGARAAARRFLDLLTARGGASFLCVIKDCGAQGKGMISFPMPGVSIALDFPVVPGFTRELVDDLNEQVIREGGRVYLAKDAFTRRVHFEAMEPRLESWNKIRRAWDPAGRFKSALSVRLLGDPA